MQASAYDVLAKRFEEQMLAQQIADAETVLYANKGGYRQPGVAKEIVGDSVKIEWAIQGDKWHSLSQALQWKKRHNQEKDKVDNAALHVHKSARALYKRNFVDEISTLGHRQSPAQARAVLTEMCLHAKPPVTTVLWVGVGCGEEPSHFILLSSAAGYDVKVLGVEKSASDASQAWSRLRRVAELLEARGTRCKFERVSSTMARLVFGSSEIAIVALPVQHPDVSGLRQRMFGNVGVDMLWTFAMEGVSCLAESVYLAAGKAACTPTETASRPLLLCGLNSTNEVRYLCAENDPINIGHVRFPAPGSWGSIGITTTDARSAVDFFYGLDRQREPQEADERWRRHQLEDGWVSSSRTTRAKRARIRREERDALQTDVESAYDCVERGRTRRT